MSFIDLFPLSQLPPFSLVTVDYEAERLALVAGVVARFQARGVPYNVEKLRSDSAMVLVEEFAYRKTLMLQTVNDVGKRFSLAFSYGAALDHIAATYYADIGVARLPAVANPRPYATNPEDWEADDPYRERIALAPDARSPYTPGAYMFAARKASVDVVDAVALNFSTGVGLVARRGDVLLIILGRQGADEAALCVTVREALDARPIKAETDTVMVRPARHLPVAVSRTVEVLHGPDEGLIKTEALKAIEAYRVERRKIGRVFAVSGIDRAAHADGVETVRPGLPATDIDPGPDGVVELTSVNLDMVAVDG